jgi:hypothetical protein
MTDLDGYRGLATLRMGDRQVTAEVRLSARFEPVEGRYRWAGRTAPVGVLLAQVRAGVREAELHIAGGRVVTARLSEPDPWGGVRLSGAGIPPWAAPGTGTPPWAAPGTGTPPWAAPGTGTPPPAASAG